MREAVTLYSGPTCPAGIAARDYLNREGIPFREINVSFDMTGLDALLRITHGRRVIPMITVGDKWMVGFHERKLRAWLR